ncbi:MAG: hypothetical protein D3913_05975, partial [Candidatus Electrothrix sp. LOE1_4_5]|nr:hypothetical protein [Candidatus Electrothrix gigas]
GYGRFSTPIDYRLYLPKSWTDDEERCLKAKIPADKGDPALFYYFLPLIGKNEPVAGITAQDEPFPAIKSGQAWTWS